MAILSSSHIGGTGALEPGGSMGVTLQDQTTPTVITKFSILEQSHVTTANVAIGGTVLPLDSVVGVSTGKYVSIFDPNSVRFTNFHVVSVTDNNVTIDGPLDFPYPSGSYVDISETNLNKIGTLGSPIVAGIRNNAGTPPPPGIILSVDITRIMFSCIADTAVDLSKFADIAILTNGLFMRKRDKTVHNIWNVKSNREMVGIMYDWDPYAATNPIQGVDGFGGRLTFAGQSKMGVTQRLSLEEDLEIFIQDDLSDITILEIIAEGSIVQP